MAAVAVLVFTFAFNGGTMSSYIQNLINLAPNRFDVTFNGLGQVGMTKNINASLRLSGLAHFMGYLMVLETLLGS